MVLNIGRMKSMDTVPTLEDHRHKLTAHFAGQLVAHLFGHLRVEEKNVSAEPFTLLSVKPGNQKNHEEKNHQEKINCR